MEYRRLGRSQLQVSAVGFGTCQLRLVPERQAIETLMRGFDLGVNIVHTAPSYGHAEDLVARAVRESGRTVVVATTGYDVSGNERAPVSHFERLFDATCERLGSARLDLYGIDCIDGQEARHENVWGSGGMIEFLLKKKEEGRLRGTFCSTHGGPEYVRKLVTCGAFDAIMLAYNILGYHLLSCNPFYRRPPPPDGRRESLARNRHEIFPLARREDVGLMIMKPLGGGLLCTSKALPPRHDGNTVLAGSTARDVLRSILVDPAVTCVLPGTASVAEAEENASSGFAPIGVDADRHRTLSVVVEGLKKTVCSRCGACDALCSREMPISWIFWAGLLNLHRAAAFEQPDNIDYFRLHPHVESMCASCRDVTCVCPDGIDIPRALQEIHGQMVALMHQGVIPPPVGQAGRVVGDAAFGARIVGIDIPRTMRTGEEYLCRFHLENAGARGWLPDGNPYADEHRARVALAVFIDGERVRTIHLPRDVHGGDRWHSSFEITAPRCGERFRLRLQLLGEHQQFSELLGPVVFSEEICLVATVREDTEWPAAGDADRRRIQLRLDELQGERNKLRAEVEGQRLQIVEARDRVRMLERVLQTLRAGRAFKLLRRLGRWKWLDLALDELQVCGRVADRPAGLDRGDGRRGDVPAGQGSAIETIRDWSLNPFFHPRSAAYGYRGHLVDPDGRDFIDFSSAWGANILGYGYPRVADAIAGQARRFSGLGMQYPEFWELERLLCSVIPGADAVRYGKNGSDATMAAVRLARAITGRERVLHRGYHGFHDWWMASTECRGIPRALNALIHPLPECTPEAVERAFGQYPNEIACLIIDPMVPPMPDRSTMRDIIESVHAHGALVIFDEVVSGFRLAAGGMQEVWGLQADLACYGKSVANGLPLSILSGSHACMRHLPSINYGMTFEGEAVSIAAALATVREIVAKDVCQALAEKGRILQREYARAASQYGIATRLAGPPARPHLVFQAEENVSERELRWLFIQELARAGVLTIGVFNVCYAHDDEDLCGAARAFDAAMGVIRRAVDAGSVAHLLDARVLASMCGQ